MNSVTFFIITGITTTNRHYRTSETFIFLNLYFIKLLFGGGNKHFKKIIFQSGYHYFCFRIAHAAIVFDHIRFIIQLSSNQKYKAAIFQTFCF